MTYTCVVTGGAGFVGCAMSAALAGQFDEMIVVDNLHPQIHPQQVRPPLLHEKVKLVIGDITIDETWDRLLSDVQPNVLLHLAAETGTGQSLTEASRHASVNVLGTTRMLDAFARRQFSPARIVLASSRAVYGEGAWQDRETGKIVYPGQRSHAQLQRGEWDFTNLRYLPSSALSTEPHPTSIYGATKLAQEQIMRAWALSFGADIVILRLQNVYGPGQSLANPYTGIVPLFARFAREGQSIPVYEDGQITRDFVFIEDVVAAIGYVVCNGAPSTDIYDVGSGQAVSIVHLATLIAQFYGAPNPRITGAFRNGDVRHASCDIAAARNDLNWTPTRSLEDGLRLLCHWIDDQVAQP
jgi:dTDP-L-rhamnose 4-epimerase